MTDSTQNTSCFTDFAIEEYVHGRLDPDVRREFEVHVNTCAACGEARKLLHLEARLLAEALSGGASEEHADKTPIDAFHLAAYLDGALDRQERESLEEALCSSGDHLSRLVALYRDLQAVRRAVDEDPSGNVAPRQSATPRGEILRMPKRTQPPVTLPLQGIGESDTQTG